MRQEVNLIIALDRDCPELAYFNKCLIDDGGSINMMSLGELESRMHEFLSNGYIAIIFEVDNIHIGYTLIDNNKMPLFIRQFFIAKQFRRKGYGKAAFNKLIDLLKVDKIDLSVLVNNEIGNKFWVSCSLIPHEIIMHYRK